MIKEFLSKLLHKNVFYYDLEVFPNFFSALFISEDFEEEYVFYMFEDRNDVPALVQFVTQQDLALVGFNNIFYDDPVLKYIISAPHTGNDGIFNFSKTLIETRNRYDLPTEMKETIYSDTPWLSIDMMSILTSNMNRPSLKHCGIHLEHSRLQDLPKAPTARVKASELDEILDYNRNDVRITGKLYQLDKIQDALELRVGLAETYGDLPHLIYADNSKIGNVVLNAEYGTPEKKMTRRPVIYGKDLIPPTLDFNTLEMQIVEEVVHDLTLIEVETKKGYTHLTYPKRKKFEHIFEFNGVTFKMAKGGLHSEDDARILRSDETHIIRDADVGSYYPMLGDYYGLVPAHLDFKRFQAVRKGLLTRRLTAKHNGDKVTADGLKITINGMFGKLNYVGFWLYDPLPFYQTTLYGQLLLLMLIEMLYLNGIDCVSANTDGIVCRIPRDREDIYFATCVEWQKKTGMSLEYNDYEFLVQKNVNSYMSHAVREGIHNEDWSISWKDKSDIKTKKDFSDNKYLVLQSFTKGYQAPIIALALQAYYKDGTPIEKTIEEEENIHNFFFTQKTGGKFDMWFVSPSGSKTKLQKTNRFYITTSGGVLIKKDRTQYRLNGVDGKSQKKGETSIWKGRFVHVLNDIDNDYIMPVNRKFYIDKVQEIIDEIEPKKVNSIFDYIN